MYKNCGWWGKFDCIFGFSVKSYVRNTINLSCAKILLTSVVIRYKDKLDTEVLCSLRMRTETYSWTLTLESADIVHTGCSEIRRVEDREFFITARSHLTERQADGDHNAICKYAHLCLSHDVLIQLNDFREIWYECHSTTEDTKFVFCFLLSVIQTWPWILNTASGKNCHVLQGIKLAQNSL